MADRPEMIIPARGLAEPPGFNKWRSGVRVSLADQVSSAFFPPFYQAIQACAVSYALGVLLEPASTPNHAARVAFARQVLAAPSVAGPPIAWAVVADNVTLAGSPDGAVETRVAGLWNQLSGPGL